MTDDRPPDTRRPKSGPPPSFRGPADLQRGAMDPVAQRVVDGIEGIYRRLDECVGGLRSLATAVNALHELQMEAPRAPSLKGFRVLLVDDEWLVLTALGRVVEAYGGSTVGARNFHEADAALAQPVDVAVIDLRLAAGQNGMEFARHLSVTHPEIGLVILTGMVNDEDRTAADEIRATVVEKPCLNIELVRALLDAKRKARR